MNDMGIHTKNDTPLHHKQTRKVLLHLQEHGLLHKSTDLHQSQDTYSEGGTHEETLHPQSKAKVGTRDEEGLVTT